MLGTGGKAPAKTATAGGAPVPFFKRDVDLSGFIQSVSQQEVAVFTRQLATLLRAGIPLAEALGALSEQSDNKKFEVVLTGVRQKVNEGSSLAETLGQHPKIFPELYTNMVRSGEAAGNLDAVLARLADFLDAQHTLRAKVSGALTYPVIMLVLGSLIMGVLMVVVVPKITSIFEDLGKTLPWNTQLLIFMADVMGSYWWAVLIFAGLSYWFFRRWSHTTKGREMVDRIQLRVPLIGPLVRYVGVARFART